MQAKQSVWPLVGLIVLALIMWLKDHRGDLTAVATGDSAAASDGRYEMIEGCCWLSTQRHWDMKL
ncbi:MAG: hypothetical protein AAGB14_07110 [Verrucomicrobiota bacterium]